MERRVTSLSVSSDDAVTASKPTASQICAATVLHASPANSSILPKIQDAAKPPRRPPAVVRLAPALLVRMARSDQPAISPLLSLLASHAPAVSHPFKTILELKRFKNFIL